MDFDKLLDKRFSVRKFSAAPVEQIKLDAILEAGRIAPTAANRQPQKLLVLNQADALAELDGCTPCRYGAPLALVVCADKDAAWVRKYDEENSCAVDASIVATYMMLAAENLGLGTLWVMHFEPAKLIEAFRLPAHIIPEAILMMGYPTEDAQPSDRHHERNPIETMAVYGRF